MPSSDITTAFARLAEARDAHDKLSQVVLAFDYRDHDPAAAGAIVIARMHVREINDKLGQIEAMLAQVLAPAKEAA